MRVLRSLMLGDCDYYLSPYVFGVAQGMTRLGHWHSQVNLRSNYEAICQRVADIRPDILWTHMLLWAPPGSPTVERLLALVEREARRGCRVIIHDGDYKDRTRHAHDISRWCALALCNHQFDRTAWRAPVLYWPYFAFAQDRIAQPDPALACDLFFAGTMDNDATYAARTQLVRDVQARGVKLRTPSREEGNTLFRTPVIAASSTSVLGFGRPEVRAWRDTRIFQYAGAGAILVHDDAPELEPWVHFAPYQSGNAESVAEAVARVRALPFAESRKIREAAFQMVQERHASVARVRQVLEFLFGGRA